MKFSKLPDLFVCTFCISQRLVGYCVVIYSESFELARRLPHHEHIPAGTTSLLCIQRSDRRLVIYLDPSSLLFSTVMVRQPPASLIFRSCQPQPHQVSPGGRRGMIGVCSPRVEDMLIRKELDVANLEDHMKGQASTCFLQNVRRFKLSRREGRDQTGVGESSERSDEVWVVPQIVSEETTWRPSEVVPSVDSSFGTSFEEKDGRPNVWFLAVTHFAFAVKVPDWLRQGLQHIWSFSSKDIVDMMSGYDVGFPPC